MNGENASPGAMTGVSYLVVNWNGGAMLAECLDSIACQLGAGDEVIVVDNGSTDGSCDLPHFSRPGWFLERLPGNVGFSAANNRAFERSRGTFIALVNNDVRLEPGWSGAMVKALCDTPGAGSAACRLLQYERPSRLDSAGFALYGWGTVTDWSGGGADSFTGRSHRPFGAVASAALYRRSAIEDVGLFRVPYFAYYEDTDLAIRLVMAGYDCVYVNDAVAVHRRSSTGGKSTRFKQYQLRRNIEYLYWLNMLGSLSLRYLFLHASYECGAFVSLLLRGHAGVFYRAKRDALRQRHWIRMERASWAARLRQSGEWRRARQRLVSRLTPWWQWGWTRLGIQI